MIRRMIITMIWIILFSNSRIIIRLGFRRYFFQSSIFMHVGIVTTIEINQHRSGCDRFCELRFNAKLFSELLDLVSQLSNDIIFEINFLF